MFKTIRNLAKQPYPSYQPNSIPLMAEAGDAAKKIIFFTSVHSFLPWVRQNSGMVQPNTQMILHRDFHPKVSCRPKCLVIWNLVYCSFCGQRICRLRIHPFRRKPYFKF